MQDDGSRNVTILGFSLMMGILSIHYQRAATLVGTSVLGSLGFLCGLDHFIGSGFSSILSNLANGRTSGIFLN